METDFFGKTKKRTELQNGKSLYKVTIINHLKGISHKKV